MRPWDAGIRLELCKTQGSSEFDLSALQEHADADADLSVPIGAVQDRTKGSPF